MGTAARPPGYLVLSNNLRREGYLLNNLSTSTKLYIFGIIGFGSVTLSLQLRALALDNLILLGLAALAAVTQIFKVEGPTEKSNYNIAWLLYGFTLVHLGVQAVLFVILIAHLAEWARHKYPWYIQAFNIAAYVPAVLAADFIFHLINPIGSPLDLQGALGLLVAIATFTLLNHTLVGMVIRLARGQSLAESGVFDFLTLATDFTLLGLGAASALIFLINPFGVILNVIPVYLLYQAVKVPALGRMIQTLEARLESLETITPVSSD
jgi:hypothetical protein